MSVNLIFISSASSQSENQETLDLNPEIINNSGVLKRWLKTIPNVLEAIQNDPSFRTGLRLGYAQFPSNNDAGGINIGVEDLFISNTNLTVSGNYQKAFNGDRKSVGGDLQYYILPLGNYINLAPVMGYRYVQSDNFNTNGLNLGARLKLVLSRNGAADITLTQTFISPGGDEEVGLTNLSVGYAFTKDFRLSTDIQQQNSSASKDSSVGISLEWMP